MASKWDWRRRPSLKGAVALACLVLVSCSATEEVRHAGYRKPIAPGARVLLMQADIECSEVTAGGLVTPKASWTAQCRKSVETALADFLSERRAELVVLDTDAVPPGRMAHYRALTKLHEAVGTSILARHAYPTADEKTDWSLGSGVRMIGVDHDADYALFVYLRDQYETGGRVATRFAFALIGVATPPALQQGFASLVDLETGDVVWFSQLLSAVGDLRDRDSAREAVDVLLDGSPVL